MSRAISLNCAAAFLFLSAIPQSSAIEIIVAKVEGPTTEPLELPIRVDDSTGITAAAFTVRYDTSALDVEVSSDFFGSFGEQLEDLGAGSTVSPFVDINLETGEQLDQPLMATLLPGVGQAVAGLRRSPSDGSNSTLLRLLVTFKDTADPGLYEINVTPTTIQNTASGHAAEGEQLNLLIDGDRVVLLAADGAAAAVTPGSASFVVSGPDSDGDGLPDSWESQHFESLDVVSSGSDHDLDGIFEIMEFFLGSNPTRAESTFAFRPTRLAGEEEFRIVFPMRDVHGLDFTPEWSIDLKSWRSSGITIEPRPDLGGGENWSFVEAIVEAPDVRFMVFRIRL